MSTELQVLEDMFVDLDSEIIAAVLIQNGGNLDTAVAQLLQFNDIITQPLPTSHNKNSSSADLTPGDDGKTSELQDDDIGDLLTEHPDQETQDETPKQDSSSEISPTCTLPKDFLASPTVAVSQTSSDYQIASALAMDGLKSQKLDSDKPAQKKMDLSQMLSRLGSSAMLKLTNVTSKFEPVEPIQESPPKTAARDRWAQLASKFVTKKPVGKHRRTATDLERELDEKAKLLAEKDAMLNHLQERVEQTEEICRRNAGIEEKLQQNQQKLEKDLTDARRKLGDQEAEMEFLEDQAQEDTKHYKKLKKELEKSKAEVWSLVQYQQARRLSFRQTKMELETALTIKERGLTKMKDLITQQETKIKVLVESTETRRRSRSRSGKMLETAVSEKEETIVEHEKTRTETLKLQEELERLHNMLQEQQLVERELTELRERQDNEKQQFAEAVQKVEMEKQHLQQSLTSEIDNLETQLSAERQKEEKQKETYREALDKLNNQLTEVQERESEERLGLVRQLIDKREEEDKYMKGLELQLKTKQRELEKTKHLLDEKEKQGQLPVESIDE